MALDKVIDSAVLDAGLTSVADAIRAKGGTSEQMAFPEGFVSAVEGIPVGGGVDSDTVFFDGLLVCNISPELSVENVIVKARYMGIMGTSSISTESGANHGSVNHQFKHLTIEADEPISVGSINCRNGFDGLSLLKSVTIKNIRPKTLYQCFQCVYGAESSSLKSVYGLDFTRCGGAAYRIGALFERQNVLENVTIVPNTCGKLDLNTYSGNNLTFLHSSLLTDESLISIANGLCADYVSTLQLHTIPKVRCDEILGTVITQTDDDEVYDFFAADSLGTVTLTEFITTTKGWTLA